MSARNILGEITPEEFLKSFWQKKPCLIRQAMAGFECPLSPDELAGLACEDGIDARLVLEDAHGHNAWQVRQGPFTADTFKQLPATHWSLLVRHVDHFVPAVSDLLQSFSFVPQWRIDDVMISYAPDQGSVGPHLDSYDVFLLQGMGERRWQINRHGYSEADFVPGLELRIIENFSADEEFILKPGDMFYLPPGVAHHGIAHGPCMTLSIGFLAPLCSELLQHYVDDTITSREADHRYTDPDLQLPAHGGEISAADLDRVRILMHSALADGATINHWFGGYITESSINPETPEIPASTEQLLELIETSGHLYRYGGIRAAYIRDADTVTLYMAGKSFPVDAAAIAAVQTITGTTRFSAGDINKHPQSHALLELLLQLYNCGYYYPDE